MAGRRAVEERLAELRDELDVDLCVVNGENVADGAGITPKLAERLLRAGADVITLGNHTYRRDGIGDYLAASERVIRPANAGSLTPGRGLAVAEARNGVRVAVLNLLGMLFLEMPLYLLSFLLLIFCGFDLSFSLFLFIWLVWRSLMVLCQVLLYCLYLL